MNEASKQSYWQEFFATLKERVCKPGRHPTFVMYFLGIIVVVGGFGIIESARQCFGPEGAQGGLCWRLMASSTYTYFTAIAATAAVDLILSYHQKKSLSMFFLLCSLGVFLCALEHSVNRLNRGGLFQPA